MTLIGNEQQIDRAILSPSIISSWIWIPIGLIGFLIISIVILAMLVVLSLIPTFLTTQHSSVTRHVFPLNLIYKTNIFNGTSLAINDVNQLTILITDALDLHEMNSVNGQFISSDPCFSNGKSDQSLYSNEKNIGDLFNLNILIQYPIYCLSSKSCQQRFIDKIYSKISVEHANLNLTISLSNKILFNINLTFCSFNNYDQCLINNGICQSCHIDEYQYEDEDHEDQHICQDN